MVLLALTHGNGTNPLMLLKSGTHQAQRWLERPAVAVDGQGANPAH